jgi:hypothetical protein
MNEERAEYHSTGSDELMPPIDRIIASHRFARTIEAAHKNGALLLLAAHLEPLLGKFQTKNELLTTVELEVLITVAARAMMNDQQ